jgi:5-methylcytosine-specific restriction endonuclease McrA
VQPVLDLSRSDAVDRHDPPTWMHELVVLRDRTCVFPGCRIDARRCDLDHVVPFDDTGPPGQTSPANLAALCRRHHNAKTHRGWRYHRTASGYEWTSPLGRTYTVQH